MSQPQHMALGSGIAHWCVIALAPLPCSLQSPLSPLQTDLRQSELGFEELISRLAREGGTEIISSCACPSLGQLMAEQLLDPVPMVLFPAPVDPIQLLKLSILLHFQLQEFQRT